MASPPVPDDVIRRTLDAMEKCGGNQCAASEMLGISRSGVQGHMRMAARRGMLAPGNATEVMEGFEITRVQTGPRGTTVEQKPGPGGTFEIPEGHRIKGVSAFVGPDGRVRGQWVKTREGEPDPERTAEIIQAAFAKFEPKAPIMLPPRDSDDERLTAYIFCDWHVGLFAYGKETGGPDWDLSIARATLSAAVKEIVETSPPSAHAVILGPGDLLHADNGPNQTERSGNVLDVDTRYSKCIETVCDLMAESSELIASKHRNVQAVCKPGNHDENSTVGIRQALRMYWRDNDRGSVCTSPDAFYWLRFGVNLIGGTHGDKAKVPDLPLIMANRRKDEWSATATRYIHTGHIQHDTEREIGGVHVYSHRAPVAQDAYHARLRADRRRPRTHRRICHLPCRAPAPAADPRIYRRSGPIEAGRQRGGLRDAAAGRISRHARSQNDQAGALGSRDFPELLERYAAPPKPERKDVKLSDNASQR